MNESVIKLLKHKGYKFVLAATMPRSGTWMLQLFFLAYEKYLLGEKMTNDMVRENEFLNYQKIIFNCCHSIFPEFENLASNSFQKKWGKLRFWNDNHFNYGRNVIASNYGSLTPSKNRDLKIIYLYRNPLDQAISAHRHFLNHIDNTARNPVRMLEIDQFIRFFQAEGYLKQFLTFHHMKANGHNNLLMIPYEYIFRNMYEGMMKTLKFVGSAPNTDHEHNAFEQALHFISKDNLQTFEKTLGRPLGDDQIDKDNESHIRGGEINKWKKILRKDTIQYVQNLFHAHDLDLESFIDS